MPRRKRTSAQVDEDTHRLIKRARAAIFAGQPPIAIYNAGYIPREIAAVLAAEEEAYLEAEARGITFIRRVSKHRRNKGASATAPPSEVEFQPSHPPASPSLTEADRVRQEAYALRAEAAYLYELLRRQVDFAGLDDTITRAAIARRKRQKLAEEETMFMLSSNSRFGQAANDFTIQWRPPERGGILSRSEVSVLLSILDKHLKSNYNPQAGALEVHFVDKAGSSTQAIRIYLAEGAGTVTHLDMMGADAIVMSSIDGILTSWRKNTPPKLPDSVKIIYNNIGRYAVLPVRSGCFLVSYAASYTAEQAQTAVRFAMATVIATLAHFAVTHGERGQPLSSARCGSVDGAMIRVENAFLRLSEPELRNWQHWHETAKPTAWQIPSRGKK